MATTALVSICGLMFNVVTCQFANVKNEEQVGWLEWVNIEAHGKVQ